MPVKVDSNLSGLRFAQEDSLKVVSGDETWYPLEPNSYGDFGAQVTTTARAPINASRQRQKGVVTDLTAGASFGQDLTQDNLYRLLPGFMFAAWRAKNEDVITAIDAATNTFDLAAGGTQYRADDLVVSSGLPVAANNGLTKVTSSTNTTVVVTLDLQADAPDADSQIKRVGHEFAAGDASITVTGGVPALTTVAKDLTELGVIPGEWIFIGGDAAGTQFGTAADNGFARVLTVAAHKIEFDKTQSTMVADVGAGKTIRVFLGDVIKNESDPDLIARTSYQLERDLGAGGIEYVVGCIPNELTFNFNTADKVTVDLGFVGMDEETRTDVEGPKAGARPALVKADAFNTSSDLTRVRFEKSDRTGLTTYVQAFKLTVNNGVTPTKALGVLGGFDASAGDFMVSGNLTAYYTDTAVLQSIRANDDATIDLALVRNNAGMVFDIPLVSLGDGRPTVAKDQPVMLPVSYDAAADATFDHTLLVTHFSYLPDLAG